MKDHRVVPAPGAGLLASTRGDFVLTPNSHAIVLCSGGSWSSRPPVGVRQALRGDSTEEDVEKQLSVIGVMSGDTAHYYKALQFLQHHGHRFNFADMLSNRYRLDQINDAMQAMHSFREVKPVVVF